MLTISSSFRMVVFSAGPRRIEDVGHGSTSYNEIDERLEAIFICWIHQQIFRSFQMDSVRASAQNHLQGVDLSADSLWDIIFVSCHGGCSRNSPTIRTAPFHIDIRGQNASQWLPSTLRAFRIVQTSTKHRIGFLQHLHPGGKER